MLSWHSKSFCTSRGQIIHKEWRGSANVVDKNWFYNYGASKWVKGIWSDVTSWVHEFRLLFFYFSFSRSTQTQVLAAVLEPINMAFLFARKSQRKVLIWRHSDSSSKAAATAMEATSVKIDTTTKNVNNVRLTQFILPATVTSVCVCDLLVFVLRIANLTLYVNLPRMNEWDGVKTSRHSLSSYSSSFVLYSHVYLNKLMQI